MSEKPEKAKKLATEPYKGVRDFYPADMAVQNYIFDTWKKAVESFGYEEYGASVLEPADIYKAKSGEEIVNEQTYTFIDRGKREVTLRPEMTPTVARMVAAHKRELGLPLRWYSIPNLFRYEQPQRGRVREHWQLNVDIFGVDSIEADIEVISLAYQIMKAFGAKDEDFEIRMNSHSTKEALDRAMEELKSRNIKNIRVDETLARGQTYYTGVVFEIFDSNPVNHRSLFGGGRYDDLTSLFGGDKVPAVGFGMGDVTMRDFLETYNLLPKMKAPADYYICIMTEAEAPFAEKIADNLREKGSRVAVDFTYKKIGDQIKSADKRGIPQAIVIGPEEMKSGRVKAKNLTTGKETDL